MKNKILIIIIFITIILLGCLLFFINSKTNDIKNKTNIKENIKEIIIEEGKFTYNQAIKSLIIINCENLVKEDINKISSCKDQINNILAIQNNDIDLCEAIVDFRLKDKCIDKLSEESLNKALESKNQELCLIIKNKRVQDKCILDIDTYYYDKSDCTSIYNSNYKLQCFDRVDSDLFSKARSEKNPKICNTLSTEDLQQKCLKDIEYNIYIDANNLDSCYKIENKELKNKCINKVKLSTGDYDKNSKFFCEQIKDKNQKIKCFDGYYLNLIQTGKSRLIVNCKKIKNEEIKIYCLSILKENQKIISDSKKITVLKKSGDIIGAINLECETTRSGTDINICKKEKITKKAISDNNLLICESLETQKLKDSCIDTAEFELDNNLFKKAVAERNIDLCNQLSNIDKKEFCLNYLK